MATSNAPSPRMAESKFNITIDPSIRNEEISSHTNLIEHSPTSKKDIQFPNDNNNDNNETINTQLPLLPLNPPTTIGGVSSISNDPIRTRLYKRRFFPLIQLSLLNIIVSWCWLTFSSVSRTSSDFFGVKESSINWLSTCILFAFVVASPAALWALNKNVKLAMLIASSLLILGNWLRFLGTKLDNTPARFGVVILGQIIIGFSQPFVLSAPTRLSHQWFSEKGRITATALASLCNPLGGALGQLIGPFMATDPDKVPNMVLYVAIITTVICIPTIFIPSAPPLPPTTTPFIDMKIDLKTIKTLLSNLSFHLIAWPFIIYVASFNATSSLLNQILGPYGFTEDQAGIDGAIMIVVGLLASAIASPILDRYNSNLSIRLISIKILVLTICLMYILLIFIPSNGISYGNLVGPGIISALIGSTSFILLPLSLEMLANNTWPIGPEVSSTICWSLSQLAGGILLISMTALKRDKGTSNEPENSLRRSLILQAVICCVVAPLPLCLGFWGTGQNSRDPKFRIGDDTAGNSNPERIGGVESA